MNEKICLVGTVVAEFTAQSNNFKRTVQIVNYEDGEVYETIEFGTRYDSERKAHPDYDTAVEYAFEALKHYQYTE